MLLHVSDEIVLPCSYRGYGKSQGQPNEAGIKLDAQAALDRLLERNDVNNDLVRFARPPSLHHPASFGHFMHMLLSYVLAPHGMRAGIRAHAATGSRI